LSTDGADTDAHGPSAIADNVLEHLREIDVLVESLLVFAQGASESSQSSWKNRTQVMHRSLGRGPADQKARRQSIASGADLCWFAQSSKCIHSIAA